MSFALPSVKPRPEFSGHIAVDHGTANFEAPNMMLHGFSAIAQNTVEHPLIQSERNYYKNRAHLDDVMLRNTQGLHAPLRLHMERKAAQKIGHLPFLPSHNVMLDSLTGRDIEVMPEDIFNTGEFSEIMGQPHAMVERKLGLL